MRARRRAGRSRVDVCSQRGRRKQLVSRAAFAHSVLALRGDATSKPSSPAFYMEAKRVGFGRVLCP